MQLEKLKSSKFEAFRLSNEMMKKVVGGSFAKITGWRRLEDGTYLVDLEYPDGTIVCELPTGSKKEPVIGSAYG